MYAIAIGLVSGKYGSPNVDFLVYTKAVREMRKHVAWYTEGIHNSSSLRRKVCAITDVDTLKQTIHESIPSVI